MLVASSSKTWRRTVCAASLFTGAACGSSSDDFTSPGNGGSAQTNAGSSSDTMGGSSSGGANSGGGGTLAGGPSAGSAATGDAGSLAGASGAGAGGAPISGTANFAVEVHLASEFQATAPGTIGIVTFSVDVPALVEAHVEFGLDTSYGTNAPVDLALADHRTLLLGMKPAQTYRFRVVVSDALRSYASDDYTVATGPAASGDSVTSFQVLDQASREPGFIIGSHRGSSGSVFILDPDGEIVWWYQTAAAGIARARISEDGKNMWLAVSGNTGAPLVRVSMDTLDSQSYSNTVGSHDITAVSGATMAYLDYSEADCDSIFEIDPSGNPREVFESSDVLAGGGCHGNALRYSKNENLYTFSDLNQDVLVVSRTGALEFRLSERVAGGNDAWGGAQHGHHLLADSLLIFANSGAGNGASQVVQYGLDGTELHRFPSNGFTGNLGDVQRLPGGNTLITYSNDSLIEEVDPQDNVVLRVEMSGQALAYSLWYPNLYALPPDTWD